MLNNLKHGHRRGNKHTPEYQAYMHAKHRCTNPKHPRWKYWGGRGIKFLFTSFEQFFGDVGPRPALGYRLDRKNNDGHYEPGNVRWATALESNQNKRQRQSKKHSQSELQTPIASGNTSVFGRETYEWHDRSFQPVHKQSCR